MNAKSLLILVPFVSACGYFENGFAPEIAVNFSTQTIEGDTAVINGDTVIFRPADRGSGYTHQNLPPISVDGTQGMVIVQGYFLAPVSGQRLEVEVSRSGNRIELRIAPVMINGPDMPQPYTYEAKLSRVEAGSYRIVVVHIGDTLRENTGQPVIVADQEVQVR